MATLVTGRMVEDQSITLNDLTQSSGALMFRNKIINGNFDIWQRGTSLTAASTSQVYLADRWFSGSATSTIAPSQVAFSFGQTAVPGEPIYFHRSVVASGNTSASYAILVQRLEGVRTFAGKNVTVSFWAKADTNKNIAVSFDQFFGTGGSSEVNNTGQKFAITSSWQKITTTFTIPSIVSKTIGTSGDFLQILFWLDAGSSFSAPVNRTNNLGNQSGTFDIAQVQVEEGSVATPFEQRPIGMELSLCQRYYQYFPSQYINNVPPAITVYYKVTMRANPQITWGGTFYPGYPVGITTENFIGYSTSNSTNSLTLNAEL